MHAHNNTNTKVKIFNYCDFYYYSSAEEGFDGTFQTKVVVYSSGNCLYIPPGIFKSTCKIDITWFPFDTQKCKMKFGSWTYSGWQVNKYSTRRCLRLTRAANHYYICRLNKGMFTIFCK